MKILYTYVEGMEPLYIQDGGGVQRVLIMFKDNGKTYCYFTDDYHRHIYLNIVINTSAPLTNSNLKRIDSDEEFYYYVEKINKNYNYDGSHIEHKLDGADRGGDVLVDSNGNKLIG